MSSIEIEETIEQKIVVYKTYVKGLLIQAGIVAAPKSHSDYSSPQDLPSFGDFFTLFSIMSGEENLGNLEQRAISSSVSLEKAKAMTKARVELLARTLPEAMRFFFQEVIEEISNPRKKPEQRFLNIQHIKKQSSTRLKERLGLPTRAGRPYGGVKFTQVEDFLKRLLSVAKELKIGKSKITINSLCRFIKPKPIDLKTFKAACERFGLDQDKLIVHLKSEALLNTKTLLNLAKKEDINTKYQN